MKNLPRAIQPLTQEQAFLRAICEDPFDDTPRLVYADWLEENGRAERAEFIRVQVEWVRDFANTHMVGDGATPWHQRRQYLLERLWTLPAGQPFHSRVLQDVVPWRRGFVEEVALSLENFLREAKELFGSLPLLRVRLTDRSPQPIRTRNGPSRYAFAWRSTSNRLPEYIPLPLFELLTGGEVQVWVNPRRTYATKQAALMDLSAACVAYGRQQAGLPPLPAGA